MQTVERVVLGEITGSHGVHGDVRVRVAGDSADVFYELETIWIGQSESDPEARRYTVLGCAPARPGEVRLRLEGISNREAAAAVYRGLVCAPRALLPELPEGEYYWYQLIGCEVESASGEPAGTVREIWETGAHDVLVVQDDAGLRRLIPTAAELMTEVDLEARRIVVVDLPGLLEPS